VNTEMEVIWKEAVERQCEVPRRKIRAGSEESQHGAAGAGIGHSISGIRAEPDCDAQPLGLSARGTRENIVGLIRFLLNT
jgi:hypothetical protein